MNVLYADTRLVGATKWVLGDPSEADMRVPDELLSSVCYLCTEINGNLKYGGTAFFVSYPFKGASNYKLFHHYLVTARHCIKGVQDLGGELLFRINTKDGGSLIIKAAGEWFYPENDAVDLAVFPVEFPEGSNLDFSALNITLLLTDNRYVSVVGPGDELLITGLFTLHRGTQRNYPILRAGVLASMPHEPLHDDAGRPYDAYLAEVRSLGGLSGSPVFMVYRPPATRPKDARGFPIQGALPVMEARSYLLLGLIRGHWDSKDGPVTPAFARDLGQVNMGIAVVTPAIELDKVLRSDRLTEYRRLKEADYSAERAPTND
jgi:hypothetical protein